MLNLTKSIGCGLFFVPSAIRSCLSAMIQSCRCLKWIGAVSFELLPHFCFEPVRVEFLFLKSLWVIWPFGLSPKSVSAIYYCFALPNEKAISLALLVQRCCLIWVSRQFVVSLVGQIFIERALCSFDRSEFNSVFVQIMVSIRLTSFGAWVGLKVWVILMVT